MWKESGGNNNHLNTEVESCVKKSINIPSFFKKCIKFQVWLQNKASKCLRLQAKTNIIKKKEAILWQIHLRFMQE